MTAWRGAGPLAEGHQTVLADTVGMGSRPLLTALR